MAYSRGLISITAVLPFDELVSAMDIVYTEGVRPRCLRTAGSEL